MQCSQALHYKSQNHSLLLLVFTGKVNQSSTKQEQGRGQGESKFILESLGNGCYFPLPKIISKYDPQV